MTPYDGKAPKKAANVSLNSDLLREARVLKVNVSGACEKGLMDEVKQARWKKWQHDNREAIEDYNRHIAKRGLFSDAWRKF